MAGRGFGRHFLGIAWVLGVFLGMFLVCGMLPRLVVDLDPLFGSRSGSVSRSLLADDRQISMQYSGSSGEDSVFLYAQKGQSIVVDYRLTIQSGSMSFVVFGPYSFLQRHVLAALGPKIELLHLKTIRASGSDRLHFPVPAEGYYKVKADAFRLMGSLDASVDAR